jgi:hypothetical protein
MKFYKDHGIWALAAGAVVVAFMLWKLGPKKPEEKKQ